MSKDRGRRPEKRTERTSRPGSSGPGSEKSGVRTGGKTGGRGGPSRPAGKSGGRGTFTPPSRPPAHIVARAAANRAANLPPDAEDSPVVIRSEGRPPGATSPTAKPNSLFMISGRERLSLGLHSVREAIKVRPHAIKRLGLREDYLRAPQIKEIADLATENNVEIRPLSAKELDNIGSGHQGAAAVITESPKFNLNALKKLDKCIVVACDGLEDPMNLGAILRSAWLLGAAGILLPQDRSVTVTTATTKVASGGAEHVPVEVVSNLPRELELMREAGFWIFGLAEKGTGLPWNFKLPEKIVWVIGSESSGLRITVERACDELVKLPQVPGGSSYNAAVAATMALYESVRQHGIPPKS